MILLRHSQKDHLHKKIINNMSNKLKKNDHLLRYFIKNSI